MQSLGAGEIADAEVRKAERQVSTYIQATALLLSFWRPITMSVLQ